MDIEGNLREVERRIAQAAHRAGRSPGEITIVAVAKEVAPEAIRFGATPHMAHGRTPSDQQGQDSGGDF